MKEYSTSRKGQLERTNRFLDSTWKAIEKIQQGAKPNADVNLFTGTYQDAWFGDVVISAKDGKLWFNSKRSPKLSGEMFYYKATAFVVKWRGRSMDADAFVNFSLDEDSKPSGMKMRAISPLTDFSYDFQDLDFKRVKK